MISVVIPARNEARTIGATLDHLEACTPPDAAEVVVAVGGSTDETAKIAARAARVVHGDDPTRAGLLNAGARAARGDVLLFLHADTLPPPDYVAAIEAALVPPAVVGGAFDFEFQERAWRLAAISTLNRLRCRLTGNFYGDQGIFVRRAVFDRLGGFPRRQLFEDVVFSQAMREAGQTVLLRGRRVRSSGRRLLARGFCRTIGLMTWLIALHALGRDTEGYAARYHGGRPTGPGS